MNNTRISDHNYSHRSMASLLSLLPSVG